MTKEYAFLDVCFVERFIGNRGEQEVEVKNKPSSARVLLVEDSDNQRRMYCLAFQYRFPGHTIMAVSCAREALAVAGTYQPNVILIDFGLPDLPGWELCERMNEDPVLERAVIISLSGRGEPVDFQRSEKAGFSHHMVKPLDLDQLEKWFPE